MEYFIVKKSCKGKVREKIDVWELLFSKFKY